MALKTGDEHLLIDAIRHGEKTLEDMGVVSKKSLHDSEDRKSRRRSKILGGGGKMDGVGFYCVIITIQKTLHYSVNHTDIPFSIFSWEKKEFG